LRESNICLMSIANSHGGGYIARERSFGSQRENSKYATEMRVKELLQYNIETDMDGR